MLGWSRCIGAPASSHPITDRPSRLVLHPPTLLPMRLIVPNPLIYPPLLAPCLALHAPALVSCHMCICSQVRLGMALRLSGSLSWSRPTAYLPAVCSPLRDPIPQPTQATRSAAGSQLNLQLPTHRLVIPLPFVAPHSQACVENRRARAYTKGRTLNPLTPPT
jgi:hypothetical protein